MSRCSNLSKPTTYTHVRCGCQSRSRAAAAWAKELPTMIRIDTEIDLKIRSRGFFKIVVSCQTDSINRRERLSRTGKVTRPLSSVRQVSAFCCGRHLRFEPVKPIQPWAFHLP